MPDDSRMTKRLIGFGLVGAILLLWPAVLPAQTVYPVAATVQWDANPSTDQVQYYTVIYNNGVSVTSFQVPASCATTCSQPISIPSSALQTVSVTSTNLWGTSAPTTITFTAKAPGNSTNVKIHVP